jgi:hypothetical protein
VLPQISAFSALFDREAGAVNDRNIIIVLGQQGQGKSLWTKQFVQGLSRLAVWDPKRSYAVQYPMDLAEWYESQKQPMKGFRVGGFYPEQAELLGSIAFAEQNTCLVLEECGLLFPSSKSELQDWARECLYLGRERGVTVIAVAQRPRSINIALRSQASRIVSFRQREEKDIDFLADFFDPDEVLNLPKLHCLDFDVDLQEVSRYSVAIPSEKPSEKPPVDRPAEQPEDFEDSAPEPNDEPS